MGREVRRVPADWSHPTDAAGRPIPLYDGRQIAWFEDDDDPPPPDAFMPDWPEEQRTHYMMYEDTTEGTPISPAFATPEELARWLVENKASAFAGETASYEAWLRVARGGFAPSAVLTGGVLQSGVEALASAGEAGTAETTEIGSVHEHAVGAAETPQGDPQ